jgi:hypothetical protein
MDVPRAEGGEIREKTRLFFRIATVVTGSPIGRIKKDSPISGDIGLSVQVPGGVTPS